MVLRNCMITLRSIALFQTGLGNESSMNRTFTCQDSQLVKAGRNEELAVVDPTQIPGTRKRSSGTKKKAETSGKEGTLIVPEDQNREPLPEGLNGFSKKRKLQSNQSKYFVDHPVV